MMIVVLDACWCIVLEGALRFYSSFSQSSHWFVSAFSELMCCLAFTKLLLTNSHYMLCRSTSHIHSFATVYIHLYVLLKWQINSCIWQSVKCECSPVWCQVEFFFCVQMGLTHETNQSCTGYSTASLRLAQTAQRTEPFRYTGHVNSYICNCTWIRRALFIQQLLDFEV